MDTFEELLKKALIPFREEYRQRCKNESVIGGFHAYQISKLQKALLCCPPRADKRGHLEYVLRRMREYPQLLPRDRMNLLKEVHPIITSLQTNSPLPSLPPELKSAVNETRENIVEKLTNRRKREHFRLDDPVTLLTGVGPRVGETLKRAGIFTVEDLLYHMPRDYQDRRQIRSINTVETGSFQVIRGTIRSIGSRKVRTGKNMVKAALCDDHGVVSLIWFNQPFVRKQLRDGMSCIASGKLEYKFGELQMVSPEIEEIENDSEVSGSVLPVYPLTEGISQRFMRKLIRSVLVKYQSCIVEIFPDEFRKRLNLADLPEAFRMLHAPVSLEEVQRGHYRLRFEEAFLLQLIVAKYRRYYRRDRSKNAYVYSSGLIDEFINSLPFTLTEDQKRVMNEIIDDMCSPGPMNRLLQGDVGSGKTILCVLGTFLCARSGFQSVILAPTEILAEQHYFTFRKILSSFGVEVALLIGSTPGEEKERIKSKLLSGEIPVVIGTHALLEENVSFRNLRFSVVDEQHKFGVLQRAVLKDKGQGADFLFTTATPIPRSLCLTFFGDLDISIISEMPPGRTPVKTYWQSSREKGRIYDFLEDEISKGGQVYIVCPLIEESEKVDATPLISEYEEVCRRFPGIGIGFLHGRLKSEEKERVMRRFANGEDRILVTTTVIEVGVDVPDATIMVILDAQRYGLGQLHQLRGRVGRGRKKSYCILVTESSPGKDAQRRLRIMTKTTSGFEIAEEDLKIRGPGDFIGTRQSGLPELRFIDVIRDFSLISLARDEAFKLEKEDPTIANKEYRLIRDKLISKYKQIWDIIH